MRKFCGLVWLLLMALPASSSTPGDDWHPGFVRLKSDRVVEGELSVRTDCDVVILRNGDAMMVYPAHKVETLAIFDTQENQRRTFISVKKEVGAAVFFELFEVVLGGEISVLRKERSPWRLRHLREREFEYFVYSDNVLLPLNKFRKKLFRRVASKDLKQYVRKHRLNLYQIHDAVRIIEYINRKDLATELAMR